MRTLSICVLCLLTTFTAVGQQAPAAAGVVHGTGAIYINGGQMADSTAVMVGDTIQTRDAVAQLTANGSTLMIQSNTIVRVQSGGFALDRGTVSMATGAGASIQARDFKIVPVSSSWTQFDVMRTGGSIQIFARKSDLTVSCGTGAPVMVKEGTQLSREDTPNCGFAEKAVGAPTAAKGPILTSPIAKDIALGTGAGLMGWSLLHSDDPFSPSLP